MNKCLSDVGFVVTTKYQPADRYWTFQLIESGIFIALATALLAICVIFVRRRDA
ncbi:MAG: hypothetical protein ACR2KJ_02295 [Jatrophihabitans sp.]